MESETRNFKNVDEYFFFISDGSEIRTTLMVIHGDCEI